MKILYLFIILATFSGCAKQDRLMYSIKWYDATEQPKRKLAEQNGEVEKGRSIFLFGGAGQPVQFKDNYSIKARLSRDNGSISIKASAGNESGWEEHDMELENEKTKTFEFPSGILVEVTATEPAS